MSYLSVVEDLIQIPKALSSCLRHYLSEEGMERFKKAQQILSKNKFNRIIFLGHSYNYFASMIPFFYLNSRYRCEFDAITQNFNKKECLNIEIDEFRYDLTMKSYLQESIFVLVTRSGQSPQILKGYEKLREANIPSEQIWTITNNEQSFISQNCPIVFPLHAGEEQIIGTKSYVNTILVSYIIARLFWGEDPLPPKLEDEIRQLIFEIKFYGQDWEYHTKNLTEFIGQDYQFLYFISKGCSMASAHLSALFSKTYNRTFGEGISIGLFLHGPFQIVDDTFRCVLITGDETSVEETIKLMELITKKIGTGKLISINNSRNLSALGRGNPNVFVFEHTTKNTYLAPIFEIIVLQFLILQMAKKKGIII
jgi:glucosamine 6-phosphate synthetase-like amidotransferase/phosphosugar isomerase protein